MQKATLISAVVGVALCAGACSPQGQLASAAENQAASLTGTMTSEAEGPLEGVLVSAKAVGGTVTVTVASDRQGHYEFPAGRLKPGDYRNTTRAAGYDLVDPGIVAIRSTPTTIDLRLEKTRDLAAQLTAAEWFMSIEEGGLPLRLDLLDKDRCTMCHSFYLITKSGHDAAGWVSVLDRMGLHSPGSSPIYPHDSATSPRYRANWGPLGEGITDVWGDDGLKIDPAPDPAVREQAAWLASINLSGSHDFNWKYPLRTFPRPTGEETRVIITQYDVPRLGAQPHDAAVDPDGMIWYLDFGQPFIGRLDPRTAEVKEWRVPALKPFPPFAPGGLDVRIGPDGDPWFALVRQGAILKFDKDTEQMTLWNSPSPSLQHFVGMIGISTRTNMLWFADHSGGQVHGLDLETSWITQSHQLPNLYGMAVLPNDNLALFSFGDHVVYELDTRSGGTTAYPTPTPLSFPRRGHVGPQGFAWFAEYWAGRFARFDSATKEIVEWPIPVPHADPYDVIPDRTGAVWAGGMATDYVFRLDPASGNVTKYLLPTVNTNIRRIDVDNSTTPVTVWIGENHNAKITKIELLGPA